MPDLSGKHGLIVGVANKRSISWAIAQAAAAAGARLALTYPSERLEENVRELAATLDNPVVAAVRRRRAISRSPISPRRSTGSSAASTSSCTAPRSRRRPSCRNPFVQTSREGFRIALDVSAYSLVALTRAVRAADGAARRRQHPDADVSRQPARLHQLQRHGRGEGGARSVGALSGSRSRPAEHPRQRASRPVRSRRWPRPASRGSRASCRSIANARRSGATSSWPRSPTPRCFC